MSKSNPKRSNVATAEAEAEKGLPVYVLASPLPRIPREGTVYAEVLSALRGLGEPSNIPEIVAAVRETGFSARNNAVLFATDPGRYVRLYVETVIRKEFLVTPAEAAEAAAEAAAEVAGEAAAAEKKAAAAEKKAAKAATAKAAREAKKAAKAAAKLAYEASEEADSVATDPAATAEDIEVAAAKKAEAEAAATEAEAEAAK